MQKLYSELVGLPVFDEASGRAPIAFIRDIILDPENGKVLAFMVKRDHVIVAADVSRVHSGLHIQDRSDIIPLHDVLRIQEVYRMQIPVIGERVITEQKKVLLGRVIDYAIDTTTMSLLHLFVAKTFLFFYFQEYVIPFRNIVQIKQKDIIVKDVKGIPVKETAVSAPEAFAA